MRRILSFDCEGATLAATLDEGPGESGLLIVSGGNEIRIGAHRGMAMLAAEIAEQGHPVFRFDRRGVGDSEGANGGFEASGPDIEAALAAFRALCPRLGRIVAFGACDAASALVLYRSAGLAGLVLANPWVIEPVDDLPPQAAIRARYAERLRDPKAWVGLLTGAVNPNKLMRGLLRLAGSKPASRLSRAVAQGIAAFPGPVTILLAARDGTAIAFADEWAKPGYAAARAKPNLSIVRLESASHSFAGAEDKVALRAALLRSLA
jgi:exosortase A-associated hydrolase 1